MRIKSSYNGWITSISLVLFAAGMAIGFIGEIWVDQPQNGEVYQAPKALMKLHPRLFDWLLAVTALNGAILAMITALYRLITGWKFCLSYPDQPDSPQKVKNPDEA